MLGLLSGAQNGSGTGLAARADVMFPQVQNPSSDEAVSVAAEAEPAEPRGSPPSAGQDCRVLPPAAWSRILLLFVGLCLIKLALVAGLSRHLCQIHWRIAGHHVNWVNDAAFDVFVCLGVLGLLQLARGCRAAGLRAVRAANTVMVSLGLLFIFLTFHTGENNYLFPIMTGVLKWSSLGWYLGLDLFFRPPYLAAWLFGYLLTYYVLARTAREGWTCTLTALCAGAYGLSCLRELAFYRDELLIADCLGLGWLVAQVKWGSPKYLLSLFSFSSSSKVASSPQAAPETRSAGWQPAVSPIGNRRGARAAGPGVLWLLPLGWTLFFAWEILRHASPLPGGAAVAYFGMLLGISVALFGGATFWAWRHGLLTAWGNLVPFYFTAFLLLTNTNYPMADNLNHLLCVAIAFPRYLAGELALAAVLAVCAGVYCRLWSKARLWWLDAVNLLLLTLALLDLRLCRIMGVRLDWEVLAFGNSPKMMWRMARPYLPGALAGLAAAVLVYVLALYGLQRWLRRTPDGLEDGLRLPARRSVVASFVLLVLAGLAVAGADKALGQAGLRLVQSCPWWQRALPPAVSPAQFLSAAASLGVGDFETGVPSDPALPPRDLNVLLVFMESSYSKHLSLFGASEETQPLLSKYKDRMELFPNFFSSFAGSIHARFATFTSLYPVRDFNAFTLRRVGVKSLFEVLHDHGYTCSLFYSSFLDYTGFRDFLSRRGLDEMYDADTMPGRGRVGTVSWGVPEEETLNAIRARLKDYAARRQKFFLTYIPAAPHYPYDGVPAAFRKFKLTQMGDYTPRYLNELLYMDWVLASLVEQLNDSGLLEKTLVIITDDHGEMLGANGGPIGHGWAVTPELANIPLIIMDPQNPGYHVNPAVGSQIDLLPTILARLRIPLPPGQLYEGRSLDAPPPSGGRLVYLNSCQGFGLLADHRILVGERQAGDGSATAPGEAVYAISNQGARTLFTPDHAAAVPRVSIGQFDEFQENFLRHYSFYSASVCRTGNRTNGVSTIRAAAMQSKTTNGHE